MPIFPISKASYHEKDSNIVTAIRIKRIAVATKF